MAATTTYSEVSPSSAQVKGQIVAFDVIYMAGLICLIAIATSAWFGPRINKSSTWFMLVISLVLTCIANLLTLGHQVGNLPPPATCLFQAAIINSMPVLYTFYATAFSLQSYLSILATYKPNSVYSRNYIKLYHSIPCIAFVAVFITNLALAITKKDPPHRAEPLGVYCHLINPLGKQITAGFIILSMSIFFLLEVLLFHRIYSLWKEIRDISFGRRVTFDTFLRIFVVSLWPFTAIIICIFQFIHIRKHETATMIIFQACAPLSMAFVFGSQKDFLDLWMFWRQSSITPIVFAVVDSTVA